MLSGTGLLSAAELPGDTSSSVVIAITADDDPSNEVSADHLVMHLHFDESAGTAHVSV